MSGDPVLDALIAEQQRRAQQRQPVPYTPSRDIQDTGRQVSTTDTASQTNFRDTIQTPSVQAATEQTNLENEALVRRAQRFGLTAEKYSEYRDDYLQLPLLRSRLDELSTRYERDFRGINPLEYGSLRSENAAFNDAAGTLRAPIAAALGLTGQQFNTPAEQEAFIGSILPNSNDRDGQIESKLARLEELFSSAFRIGQNYGFRYPSSIPMESEGWRFSPDQEQQALDLIRGDQSPEDAARSILQLGYRAAGSDATPSDEEVASYAQEVSRVRAELAQPGALLGGFRYEDPAAQPQPERRTGLSALLLGDGSVPVTTQLAQGFGDIVEGGMALPGMFNDAGNALLNMTGLPEALGYQPFTTNTASYTREALGLPRSEGMVGEINRGAASVLTPAGGVRVGGRLLDTGTNALMRVLAGEAPATTVGQRTAQFLSATPRTDAAAAAAGGVAAEQVRREGGGPIAQTTAAILAGTPMYAAGRGSRFVTEPGGTGILAQNAEREGISLMPADTGGSVTRSATAGANLMPLSAGPLEQAAENSVASVNRAVQRNVANTGQPMSAATAGEVVRDASGRLVDNTMQTSGAMLENLSNLAVGVRPQATSAMKLLEDRIDALNAMPNRNEKEIEELTAMLDDLRPGIGIEGLRDLRTDLRSGISFDGRVRSSREQNFNKRLSRALGDDIEAGLAQRPDALDAYREFNTFYSGQAGIMDVFERVVGTERSGEQIAAAINGMARSRGDRATLSAMLDNLDPADAGNLRATMIDGLGRAEARPDADFSLAAFTRNWESMPSSTKRAIFGDGDTYDSLDRIYRVATEMQSAQRLAANPSGTARGMVGLTGSLATVAPMADYGLSRIGNMIDPTRFSDGGSFLTAAVLTAGVAGGQRGYGHLLANPDFANWLSRAPREFDPLSMRNYAERLATIAAQNPTIASDLRSLQTQLQSQSQGNDEEQRNRPRLAE